MGSYLGILGYVQRKSLCGISSSIAPAGQQYNQQQLQIQILTTGADLLEDERNLTEEIGWKQSR